MYLAIFRIAGLWIVVVVLLLAVAGALLHHRMNRTRSQNCRALRKISADKSAFLLALFAWLTVSLAVALLYAGGGFYSSMFPVFLVLIWIGFPTSVAALLAGVYAAVRHRTPLAFAAIALCVFLYLAWLGLILSQPD